MPRPDKIYQALEPTFTASGCSSLLVTTGNRPANPSAAYWRRCLVGEGHHHPVFIPATARPDRDEAWLEQKRRTILPDAFSTEYALTWEQAIAGSGGHVFTAAEVEAAMSDAPPLVQSAQPGRKYVIGWDIGSRRATIPSASSLTSPRRSWTSLATFASRATTRRSNTRSRTCTPRLLALRSR
jgi:hypothetical protein